MFQHTATRRRLRFAAHLRQSFYDVSTHSRAEAAAVMTCLSHFRKDKFQHTAARRRLHVWISTQIALMARFNTQPRGGGCPKVRTDAAKRHMFQHTAARRRLQLRRWLTAASREVSTHSRAEAAAPTLYFDLNIFPVSTHSRAEAAAART